MDVFEIEGGRRLEGAIEVRGSKNATTPILAATLLSQKQSIVSGIPLIEDVFRMLEILESLGARVEWKGKRTVAITPGKIDPRRMNGDLIKGIRSSILLLGPLSARIERFTLHQPGGCIIGKRPMDTHVDILAKLGVVMRREEKGYRVDASNRKAGLAVLREFSVTATENAMMLAAGMPGRSVIKIAAAEPHIEDLGRFLIKMGVKIKGLGTHTIEIEGAKKLSGARHTVIPDANEAATFLILGVATGSPITVKNARQEHLDLVLEKLREFGAEFTVAKRAITIIPAKKLSAVRKVETRTYPGIPTDIQAPLTVLATQAEGETLVFDTLFEGRFNHAYELEKMGAKVLILNPHQVMVLGKTPLRGTDIRSYDLRGGAALIIAALCARGTTVIEEAYQVDRGYERIEERLQRLGARIRRIAK